MILFIFLNSADLNSYDMDQYMIYIHSEKLSYQYRVTLRIFARGVFGMKPTDTNFYTAAAIFPPIHNFNGVAASVKAHE